MALSFENIEQMPERLRVPVKVLFEFADKRNNEDSLSFSVLVATTRFRALVRRSRVPPLRNKSVRLLDWVQLRSANRPIRRIPRI